MTNLVRVYGSNGLPQWANSEHQHRGRYVIDTPEAVRDWKYDGAEGDACYQFGTIENGQVVKAGTLMVFNGYGKLIAHPGISKNWKVTFAGIAAGKTQIIGGLTWTAGGSGTTAAQLATAFADIASGTGYADLADRTGGGSFTAGTLTDLFTQSYSADTVYFYSTQLATDVTDIADTGDGANPTIVAYGGVKYEIAGWVRKDFDATSAEIPHVTILTEGDLDIGCEADYRYYFKLKGSATDTVNGVACTHYDTGCWGQDAEAISRRFNLVANTGFSESHIDINYPS